MTVFVLGWRFMTVFNWCENPSGTWQLVFEDGSEDYTNFKKRDMEDEYIHYLVCALVVGWVLPN